VDAGIVVVCVMKRAVEKEKRKPWLEGKERGIKDSYCS
jgi:hypothetical protein